MSTVTDLDAAVRATQHEIDAIVAGTHRHAETVEATRRMEASLDRLAGTIRAAIPHVAEADRDEMELWAQTVEAAALPDGSEGMTLSEWGYEIGDALTCLDRCPLPLDLSS